MQKTKTVSLEEGEKNKITVDINGLQALLGCGMATAKKIASAAGANLYFGRRRLYNVDKIRKYMDEMGA